MKAFVAVLAAACVGTADAERQPVDAGCFTLSAADCCSYYDGRASEPNSPCVVVADVEYPARDKSIPCQPEAFVLGGEFKGRVVGCSSDSSDATAASAPTPSSDSAAEPPAPAPPAAAPEEREEPVHEAPAPAQDESSTRHEGASLASAADPTTSEPETQPATEPTTVTTTTLDQAEQQRRIHKCIKNYVDLDACDKWIIEQEHLPNDSLGYDMPEDAEHLSPEAKLAWCEREYVDPDQCDQWAADEIARDQEARRVGNYDSRDYGRSSNGFDHRIPRNALNMSSDAQARLCAENYVDPEDCQDWITEEMSHTMLTERMRRVAWPSLVLAMSFGAVASLATTRRHVGDEHASEPLLGAEAVI